jgi:hypothetical protein
VARELHPRISSQSELDRFKSSGTVAGLLLVRHPFHRLVSAYRDKLERTAAATARSDYYYKLYGEKIYSRYRAKALAKFGKEFFDPANNFGTPVAPTPRNRRAYINPIFWEFVQFVRDAKRWLFSLLSSLHKL